MAYFICEKQGRCCPHEFYDSIEQAITDSEDGVPCDHLIEVAPVRHGRWICMRKGYEEYKCSVCHGVDSNCSDYYGTHVVTEQEYCPYCGTKMDLED